MTPEQTAAHLLAGRRAGRVWDMLPGGPADHLAGIAAQRALARLVGADPPAGFKIGATAGRMQRYLGLPGPLAAFMAEGAIHGDGSTLSYADRVRPGVECEIAVCLAHDLPGPCTAEQAAGAVAEVMAGIELVENRYADLARFGAPALVADQVFHAACVLGRPADDWRLLDLLALAGIIAVDGVTQGQGVGAELLGGPMQALAWLAGSAEAAAFGGLRAGQVIMLGSVCPPVWLSAPGTVTVSFPPLPMVTLSLV